MTIDHECMIASGFWIHNQGMIQQHVKNYQDKRISMANCSSKFVIDLCSLQ